MELSERKKQILCLAIEEYIKDSCPITSGGVSEHFKVSTATLRNELNSLEAMGYLKQLHTSGGRVPTALGYRYYVENMLSEISASQQELVAVQSLLSDRSNNMIDMVSQIAKIISKETNLPTVIMLNGIDSLKLTDIQIVKMLGQKCMVLIGTNSGYISDTIESCATSQDCEDVSKLLCEYFKGETISYMLDNISTISSGIKSEISGFSSIITGIISGLEKIRKRKMLSDTTSIKTLVEKDSLAATKVLDLLENESELAEKLSDAQGQITVDISDEEDSCSVVKAPIEFDGNQLACIGVLGPQNMDYLKIAGAIKVISECLNNEKGDA